jgi:hypothetical protein
VETRVHWYSYLIKWQTLCDKLTNVDTFMLLRWILFWGMVYYYVL